MRLSKNHTRKTLSHYYIFISGLVTIFQWNWFLIDTYPVRDSQSRAKGSTNNERSWLECGNSVNRNKRPEVRANMSCLPLYALNFKAVCLSTTDNSARFPFISLPSNYCRFESTAIIGLQLIVLRFRCHHQYHRRHYYHHHSRQRSRGLAFTLLSTGHMRLWFSIQHCSFTTSKIRFGSANNHDSIFQIFQSKYLLAHNRRNVYIILSMTHGY